MIPGRPTYDRSARPTEMGKKKPSRVVGGACRRTPFQPPRGKRSGALCVIIETRVRLRAVRLVNKKKKINKSNVNVRGKRLCRPGGRTCVHAAGGVDGTTGYITGSYETVLPPSTRPGIREFGFSRLRTNVVYWDMDKNPPFMRRKSSGTAQPVHGKCRRKPFPLIGAVQKDTPVRDARVRM